MELLHRCGVKQVEVLRAAAACIIFTILETVCSLVYICAPVRVEVLLPCVCSELHRLSHRVSDVVLSSPDARLHHHMFRGRVESVPLLQREGDFSILPESLQKSHSSSYNCYIPQLAFKQMVNLSVSDDCVSEPQAPPGPSSGHTRFTPGCLHLTTSLTLLIFIWLNPSWQRGLEHKLS